MAEVTDTPDPAEVALALRALARDLGDPYRMPDAVLAAALAQGRAAAVLAQDSAVPVGVALFSPYLSTSGGWPCAFVTDLWVDAGQRGGGLGRRLLAAVRDTARARWGAEFLRLNHYADNPGAAAFYARLGFRGRPKEVWLTLDGAALEALG